MKQTLSTLLLGLCLSVAAVAAPVSREAAMQKARSHMAWLNDSRPLTAVAGPRLAPGQKDRQQPAYHVFNRGTDGGYIIISGDDQTEEVLGYCDTGSFNYGQLPTAMQEWLDGCAAQIERLGKGGNDAGARQGIIMRDAVSTHPAVEQLMDCTWNQGSPYNDECPMYFSLGRSVTGCVATAMAQILYYNRDKSVSETQAAMPAYDTWTEHPTYGHLHVNGIPAGAPLDWDNMLPSYGSGATAIERLAVAQLMHYCGVAVHMDYTNSASGAQSSEVATALTRYFGYGQSVRYISASDYSDSEWDQTIYNEMAAGRAVYLSGANATAGHAFVCDGYDGNRRYHINWGWGGQSNGYYLLTNLAPGSQGIGGSDDGYNSYRDAVVGIEPVNYATKAMTFSDATVRALAVAAFDTDGDGTLTYGEAADVKQLGRTFSCQNIKTFNELYYYFTGLTDINDNAFESCAQLTTLKLPKALKTIGRASFSGCTRLHTLVLPEGVTDIGEEAFADCSQLTALQLPTALTAIAPRLMKNCTRVAAINLPIGVTEIADNAFSGMAALKTFTLNTIQPDDIALGSDIFAGTDLSQATLVCQQGTRQWLQQNEQWQHFGNIRELRNLTRGQFAEIEAGKKYFFYNVGTGRFLTKGEAWGTQAVVGSEPMRFVVNHSSNMPEGIFHLTSEDTGKSGRYLFRTTADNNVGQGVKAAFVDGASLTTTARWNIQPVAEGQTVYTIQVPQNDASYTEGQYWGVQPTHASNAAQPTYGVYFDVDYAQWQKNCQWRLVEYDADAYELYRQATTLGNLLQLAATRKIDATAQQAVYDNMESTLEQVLQAQQQLRKLLSLVHFADDTARDIFTSHFDIDSDGEISLTEASMVDNIGTLFYGTAVKTLDELQHFTSLTTLYGNSFEGCTSLESITLPETIETMYYRVFRNCKKLTEISLPAYVTLIGDNNFDGCTALRTVRMYNPDPSSVALGNNVFLGVPLSQCVLYVPFGSRELYASAPVWKLFGTIKEMRTPVSPRLSAPVTGTTGYIYNVATRRYLNRGEAWGSQAVVARQGMAYQLRRTTAMPEGCYYLTSSQTTDTNGSVLFRTDNDSKVGTGVKACFTDGNLSAKAYWHLEMAGDSLFTLQVPQNDSAYVEGHYLGTQSNHASDVASPTNGAYWDIERSSLPQQCLWGFVSEADMQAAKTVNGHIAQLRELLTMAADRGIDATDEQATYDDPAATPEQIAAAVMSLREKLHFINFGDDTARRLCLAAWDTDGDGELTFEEAASVTTLAGVFQNQSKMTSLEELRYFTALTEIPEKAFTSCTALSSIYIPAAVSRIGDYAFQFCRNMKYAVMLNPGAVVSGAGSSLMSAKVQCFVPEGVLPQYAADAEWAAHPISAYTGVPVVSADSVSRLYGRTLARMTYTVSGAPINGEPELSQPLATDATTPVGQYPIAVSAGTITSPNLRCEQGVLTITPAALTITANSYKRYQGEPNPEFEVTYRGFRNRETSDVLTQQPTVGCEATQDSPAGEYEITVGGAEAQNYEISYVSGTLTVEVSAGIADVTADSARGAVYDIQGRRVAADGQAAHGKGGLRRGVYIHGGRKHVVR